METGRYTEMCPRTEKKTNDRAIVLYAEKWALKEMYRVIRPILFNTGMVRAILAGRKTATRRRIDIDISNQFDVELDRKTVIAYINQETGDSCNPAEICRYQPGDIMYVRETWSEWTDGYVYKAWTSPFPQPGRYSDKMMKWSPSIHMPKEAARIFLKVTDVRIERLQDMTLNDFLNEGISIPDEAFNDPENAYMQAKRLFAVLWDSTIKKSDQSLYGWNANPWAWVIEFERCERPEGWCV